MAQQSSFNVCDFITKATTKIDDMKSLSVNLITRLFTVCTCQPPSILEIKGFVRGVLSLHVWLSVKGRDLEMVFGDCYGRAAA